MAGQPQRGKNIVNAISDLERKQKEQKLYRKKQASTIKSDEGQLVTVQSVVPLDGCVPEQMPCGACAGCKHRAALKTALHFGNPAERAAVLERLGLALLVEPAVRGPHTSPLLSEAARQALSAEQDSSADAEQDSNNPVVIGYNFEAAAENTTETITEQDDQG